MARTLIAAAIAAFAAAAPAAANVDREVIVRFAAPVTAEQRADVREDEDVRAVEGLLLPGTQVVRVAAGAEPDDVAAELEARPEVLWAEPNFEMQLHATPNDPQFGQQWGLHNEGQLVGGVGGLLDRDVDAPEAWDVETGDAGVVVAVLDSGVNAQHFDLSSQIWQNPDETTNGLDDDGNGLVDDTGGWDFIDDDNDPRDEHGHGSATSGTAVGRGNDNLGMTGVSQRGTILPVRVATRTGSVPGQDYLDGLTYAAPKADIVNLSLGGIRQPFQGELDVADANPQTLFVTSSGNDGLDIDPPNTPASPCAVPRANFVCVGATDQSDVIASFSNVGDANVDLAAPGVRILTPKVFTTVLEERFDLPLAGRWVTGGTNNTWGLSAQANPTFAPFAVSDSPGVNYLDNTNSTLETAPALQMDLSTREVCRMSYNRTITVADGNDGIRIELDDGSVSTEIRDDTANATGTLSNIAFLPANGPFTTTMKLRFRFVSDGSGTAAGAVFDNILAECLTNSFDASSFTLFNGTSFSAPMASGTAVLLKSAEPEITVAGLREALLAGVDPVAGLAGLVQTGGRLNARGALDALGDVLPQPAALAPDPLATTGATLRGTVEDNGRPTTARFEYGTTTAYGTTTPLVANADGPLEAAIGGLAPSTTYHVRVVAESAMGTKRSADRTFTTPGPQTTGGGGTTTTSSAPPTPAPPTTTATVPPPPPPRRAVPTRITAPASALLRGSTLSVALRNETAVPVTGTITARGLRGSFRIAAGGRTTVRIRLSKKTRRALRRARRLRLTITVRANGQAPITTQGTVRLRR